MESLQALSVATGRSVAGSGSDGPFRHGDVVSDDSDEDEEQRVTAGEKVSARAVRKIVELLTGDAPPTQTEVMGFMVRYMPPHMWQFFHNVDSEALRVAILCGLLNQGDRRVAGERKSLVVKRSDPVSEAAKSDQDGLYTIEDIPARSEVIAYVVTAVAKQFCAMNRREMYLLVLRDRGSGHFQFVIRPNCQANYINTTENLTDGSGKQLAANCEIKAVYARDAEGAEVFPVQFVVCTLDAGVPAGSELFIANYGDRFEIAVSK